jgi:hypothetical protein
LSSIISTPPDVRRFGPAGLVKAADADIGKKFLTGQRIGAG